MSAGGGDAYRWQGWQAREAQRLNICTCDTRFVQQNNIFDRKSWKKVSSHVCDDKETRPNETSGHIRLFLWLRDLTRAMFRKTVPGVFDETSGHLRVCLWQEDPVLLNETSRHIRPCVRQQNQLILTRSLDISNLLCGNKTKWLNKTLVLAVFVATELGVSNETSQHLEPSLLWQTGSFQWDLGASPAVFVPTKPSVLTRPQDFFQMCFWWPKHDLLPTLMTGFLYLDLPEHRHKQDKMKNWT